MDTRLQLSGNWLASRLGTNTSVAPTADDQRVLDVATSKLKQVSSSNVDIQLANTSWLVLKDRVDEYSNMVAVVQLAQDDLGSVADYLAQIQQGYDTLSGMTEPSQAQTDQNNYITQLELKLSDFIGRRSVTMSDISLFNSPGSSLDKMSFKAIDSDASTPSTDIDTFALLEVDLAEVLNSTHESSTCPICQSMASAQKANADVPKSENLGVSKPRSEEAPATNSANGCLRFTGMMRVRTSSVAPCSERARRNCSGSSASLRICGARPLVEMVIFRAPMPPPHGAFSRRRAFNKWS